MLGATAMPRPKKTDKAKRPTPKLTQADRDAIDSMVSDPAIFSEAVFGRTLWRDQRAIAASVQNNKYTIVRSGAGVGKTAIAAHVAFHFLSTRPGSIVYTTATTWEHVRDGLWKEMSILAERAQRPIQLPSGATLRVLNGKLGSLSYHMGHDWFARGISTKTPENFQGKHSRGGVLIVADEASGIPDEIFHAMMRCVTSDNDKFFAIGNPTKSSGWFFDAFHGKGEGWMPFHIDLEQTPWVKRGLPPPAHGLSSAAWIEEEANRLGSRDHPLFRIGVNGEFDVRSDYLMLSLADIIAAESEERFESTLQLSPCSLGVDIGWQHDKTVLTRIHGDRMTHIHKVVGNDPMQVTGVVMNMCRENPVDIIAVDTNGIGAGVWARLHEQDMPVMPYYGSAEPMNKAMYANLRAESFHELSIGIKNGGLYILKDEELRGQLAFLPIKRDSTGRLLMWKKEDMQREGRPSPDCADSLTIARWAQKMWHIHHNSPPESRIHAPSTPGVFAW